MQSNGQRRFRFRQFSMTDARSALKIGTDGVLAGAWTETEGASAILDVGTGCGIIALMIAQRNPFAQIDAVEIDFPSTLDARENISASPFSSRINVFQSDFLDFNPAKKYDLIVSNPPFFSEDTVSPHSSRAMARNSRFLPLEDFARHTAWLLAEEGGVSLIYPRHSTDRLLEVFSDNGLYLSHRTDVRESPLHPVKRSLLAFHRQGGQKNVRCDELCLRRADGRRSAAYMALTDSFHPDL